MAKFSLYHRDLGAFIASAKAGSFTKAARALFITPTALVKRINLFEERLGVKLFERTPRGLVCTRAGKRLLEDAGALVALSDRVLEDVRRLGAEDGRDINIGTSSVFSGRYVIELWYRHQAALADSRLRLISFENERPKVDQVLRTLGGGIDILAGVFDERFLERYGCAGLVLERVPIACSVSVNHPLARRERIALEALAPYRIFIPERGMLEDFDAAHRRLLDFVPEENVEEFNLLDLEIFNRAERGDAVVVNIGYWGAAHPLFKTLPLDWDLTARFGLIHAAEPSKRVEAFLRAVSA